MDYNEKYTELLTSFIDVENNIDRLSDNLEYDEIKIIVNSYFDLVRFANTYILYLDELDMIEIKDFLESYLSELQSKFNEKSMITMVSLYLKELELLPLKNDLFSGINDFEGYVIKKPVILIDVELINELISKARTYAKENPNTLYFYIKNPFEIDNELGVSIPQRVICTDEKIFIDNIYNYLLTLFNTYKNTNHDSIILLENKKNSVTDLLYEYYEFLNKYLEIDFTNIVDPYNEMLKFLELNKEYLERLVSIEIERFYDLFKKFNDYTDLAKKIEDQFKNNEYVALKDKEELFDKTLSEFKQVLRIIENGVGIETEIYIETEKNLKDLTLTIIELSKDIKREIKFNIKYGSILNEEKVFQFYETSLFLEFIKKYYYDLMTYTMHRNILLTIDDIGDETIDDLRNNYKRILSQYNALKSYDLSFMDEIEILEFLNEVDLVQSKLKDVATDFFNEGLKTSPISYFDFIENTFTSLLDSLTKDKEELEKEYIYVKSLPVSDEKKEALNYVKEITKIYNSIREIYDDSKIYIYLGTTRIIEEQLLIPFEEINTKLRKLFLEGAYNYIILDYNTFHNSNLGAFKLYYKLDKLHKETKELFGFSAKIETLYIEATLSKEVEINNDIRILSDIFKDDYYKVRRFEFYSLLDSYYAFIVDLNPNEKDFFMNEKSLKKILTDNELMKLAYFNIYISLSILDYQNLKFKEIYPEEYNDALNLLDRIENLVYKQNIVISNIKRVLDNSTSEIDLEINFSFDEIDNIISFTDTYNKFINDYKTKLEYANKLIMYESNKTDIVVNLQYKRNEWKKLINSNQIKEISPINYYEMSPIVGNVPFKVELSAELEVSELLENGEIIENTIKWYIDGTIIEGRNISYIFNNAGDYDIRCEMLFSTGEISTRTLKVELDEALNTDIVKTDTIKYEPLIQLADKPLLTYFDSKESIRTTKILDGIDDISAAIDSGELRFNIDETKKVDNSRLVILGYEGSEIAGSGFDLNLIYEDDFIIPDSEFLFDFICSAPLGNNISIDISNSQLTNFMAKIPSKIISSVYDIDDIGKYQSIGSIAQGMPGDYFVFKNKYDRYMVLEILEITDEIDFEKNASINYSIDFKFHVNVALNKSDRLSFKPKETNYVVPTLVFKMNNIELFNNVIVQLEELNSLQIQLENSTDTENINFYSEEIKKLEADMYNFYINKEYHTMLSKLDFYKDQFEKKFILLDETQLSMDNIDLYLEKSLFINQSFKTIKESTVSNEVYNIKENYFDLQIIIEIYTDMTILLNLIIETYNYKKFGVQYYFDNIKQLSIIDSSITFDTNISESLNLQNFLIWSREQFYKLKIMSNMVINTSDVIVFSNSFDRYTLDGTIINEMDFYFYYKKIELEYGYENYNQYEKAQIDLIGSILSTEKEKFGKLMSSDDILNISNYIKVVEDSIISEYDSFFLIPLWLDYIDKRL